ncbi:MAG: AraC-like DNA-binding protein [Kiritimatiellia bacterium]|jgi:AraC-like DNA-binding protein
MTDTSLEQICAQIRALPEEHLNLSTLGEFVAMSPRTLAEQVKRNKIRATLFSNRYRVDKEEACLLATGNYCKIRGWNRLVDICKAVGIHRNIGESICRQCELPCELDLNGHMRVPPEAELHIKTWVDEKMQRQDWVRKTDFAKSIGEHPTLIDTVCRKIGLSIDHDMSGLVVLSPEAQAGFLEWRERRDMHRQGVIEQGARTFYSLAKAAEDAARFFAAPGTAEFDKMAKTYYRRFSFWIQEGLPYRTIKGKKYFTTTIYKDLVDDLSVAEAARVAGVCKTTIKSWIRSGCMKTHSGVAKRRSLSKEQFVQVLRAKYLESPVLRKKEFIPVKVLPSLLEWAETLDLRGEESVLKALSEAMKIPERDLEPLASGCGLISRQVKAKLDEWSLLRESGMMIDVHPEYQGMRASKARAMVDEMLRKNYVPGEGHVIAFLSVFTGAEHKTVQSWLQVENGDSFLKVEVSELLEQIMNQKGARFYSGTDHYQIGDFLVHPHTQDYGTVTGSIDAKRILVDWKHMGELQMVHAPAPVEAYGAYAMRA